MAEGNSAGEDNTVPPTMKEGTMDEKSNANKGVQKKIEEAITQKYNEKLGKQLFVYVPQKLPEDNKEFLKLIHGISPLIIKARKPRQKYARFCLVDFKNQEDRDKAWKEIKGNKAKPQFKGVSVSLPRTENERFISEVIQRKLKSIENKKAKLRIKRAAKHLDQRLKKSTAVSNLLKSAAKTEEATIIKEIDGQKK